MNRLFTKMFVLFSAALLIYPVNFANADTESLEIDEIAMDSAIEDLFTQFTQAGLKVIDPQLIQVDDLEDEPHVTDDMYDFGVMSDENDDLLISSLYAVEDEQAKQTIVDYYREMTDYPTHIFATNQFVLVMDKNIPDAVAQAYETILMGQESSFEDLEETLTRPIPRRHHHHEKHHRHHDRQYQPHHRNHFRSN